MTFDSLGLKMKINEIYYVAAFEKTCKKIGLK